MKLTLLSIFSAAALFAQPLSFGVKGGLPLTDFIDTVSDSHSTVHSVTNRYIIGPTAELRLPFGFGVEVDALYRHFSYNATANLVDASSSVRATAGDWEFPILLKKRFGAGPIRPFVDAGVNFDKVSGLSRTVSLLLPSRVTSSAGSSELKNDFTTGFTIGGGVQLNLLLLKITPEIRYTRWGNQQFNGIGGSLTSNQNQAEFLVGLTF